MSSTPLPRYSNVYPKPSPVILQYTGEPQIGPPPYDEDTICTIVQDEKATLVDDENIYRLRETPGIELSLRFRSGTEFKIKDVLNRQVEDHGEPVEARYAEYTLSCEVLTQANFPEGTAEYQVKISDIKTKRDSPPLRTMPESGTRGYIVATMSDYLPKDAAIIVCRPARGSMGISKSNVVIQKITKQCLPLEYIINRNLVHSEITPSPPQPVVQGPASRRFIEPHS